MCELESFNRNVLLPISPSFPVEPHIYAIFHFNANPLALSTRGILFGPDFIACKQQKRRQGAADQRLCFRYLESFVVKLAPCKRGSYKVWEISMGVCPRLAFYNIMVINCPEV